MGKSWEKLGRNLGDLGEKMGIRKNRFSLVKHVRAGTCSFVYVRARKIALAEIVLEKFWDTPAWKNRKGIGTRLEKTGWANVWKNRLRR